MIDTEHEADVDVDVDVDVVVVGFGCAGGAAALEARRAGASVVVLERASGAGGSSAQSGGELYLGGGTALQRDLGFEDDADNMLAFLRAALGPHADEEKLRLYCEGSVEHFDWFCGLGLEFEKSLYDAPSWMPPTTDGLMWLGENAWPYDEIACPVPRGHRPATGGFGGWLVMDRLVAACARGGVVTETYTGSLGPSVRAVVPVFDGQHRVVALVAVGITIAAISAELQDRVWPLLGVAAAVLLVGACGGWLVSARLKRQTRGIAPAELSNLFEYHEAVLHSVREGVLLVGRDGRVGLCNDGARTLLGLSGDPVGKSLAELGLSAELAAAFTAPENRTEELHLTDARVLVVSTTLVRSGGRAQGTVVILRDHTELQTLTGELTTARSLAEALRSQAHEAANRLHTVVSLVELGRPEDAVEFATAELALAQELTDRVMSAVAEPVLAALLLGKAAEASERGVELTITPDTMIDDLGPGVAGRDLVTILGNLIDNGIDAVVRGSGARPSVVVTARSEEDGLLLRVADNGPGVPEEAVGEMFRRGWSTKAGDEHGLGLALVVQAVRRYGGTIDVGRDGGAVFTVRLPKQEVPA